MSACGLLGKKLGHSLSPQLHALFGSYAYTLYEKSENELADFLCHNELRGLNVTIPYKQTVLPYCDTLSEAARQIGSVNTLLFENGGIHGENTDAYGFAELLKHNRISVEQKKVLVLGSGGASKAVQYVLRQQGARVLVISRQGEYNYVNITSHTDASMIVNATPLGMFPDNGNTPLDLTPFTSCKTVIDLIYNPCRTALLLQAEQLGMKAVNGLYMLAAQAKKAAELFENREIPNEHTEKAFSLLSGQMQNIVLIGMPSCGKTTVGRQLAEELRRPFFDSDEVFEQTCGSSPEAYLRQFGEPSFRERETQVLNELCKQNGAVIATGGGVVTRVENRDICRQNGVLVYLDRPLTALTAEGRPLSKQNGIEALAAQRLPLYRQWADLTVRGDSAAAAVQTVRKELQL